MIDVDIDVGVQALIIITQKTQFITCSWIRIGQHQDDIYLCVTAILHC